MQFKGQTDDLYSGFWGGATHNPALALVEILAKLYNPDGTIAVPGFYDDVVALTVEECAMLAKNAITEEQFKEATGRQRAPTRRDGAIRRSLRAAVAASRLSPTSTT